MPADATSRELALRAAAMAGRRIGVLGIAGIVLWLLAVALRVVSERLLGWAPARIDCAGGAGLGVLFLALTATPLLIWPEQRPEIAPLLLVACVPGTLVIAIGGFLRARWRARVSGPIQGGVWASILARVWPPLTLLLVQGVLVDRFLAFVDGRLPLPGDHSSFLYRYHVLLHTLPRLRGYDPWWNAGVLDPSAMLSGATATLAISWPLLTVWRLPDVYAAIVGLVGVVLVPWCLFATTRVLGASRLAALLAGLWPGSGRRLLLVARGARHTARADLGDAGPADRRARVARVPAPRPPMARGAPPDGGPHARRLLGPDSF